MNSPVKKIRTVTIYIGLSVAIHLLILLSIGRFGSYSFAAPVNSVQAVMVDLTKPQIAPPARDDLDNPTPSTKDDLAENTIAETSHTLIKDETASAPPAILEHEPIEPKQTESAAIDKNRTETVTRTSKPSTIPPSNTLQHIAVTPAPPPPLRTAGEFLTSKNEKLSYLVSLRGIPVGNVELEAKNENGEVRITLRTKSNAALSGIYPVDNIIETRHIVGNYIITKIRQHEGTLNSETGFTIFLRDKRVFWVDRLRKRYANETIPTSEVLDTLSSFYYLRNRPLQIGTTEILHIYDGDVYASVPIEILRQEDVRLRNLKKVDSLLLRHIKQKGGIFRRTGDMMIWLTNDENKVPIKMETTTPLGKVTLELVAAETQPYDSPEAQK